MRTFWKLALCATAAAALGACASTSPLPEEPSDDGFLLAPGSLLDELYVAPGVSLAKYRQVMIDPIEVTFRKDWRRKHEELSEKDFGALQTRLAKMLRETLEKELARGGYTVTERPGTDVLRVRPSLENIDLVAPETTIGVRTYARSAGEMTLRILAFDGESGALVARARDYNKDPETQILEGTDRIATNQAALRMFEKWAEALRSVLDVANVGVRTLKE
jgi:hypothetical protein